MLTLASLVSKRKGKAGRARVVPSALTWAPTAPKNPATACVAGSSSKSKILHGALVPCAMEGTDWLGFMANSTRVFSAVAPKIRAAMDATGTTHIVDLCSGGGGPWLTLEPELAKSGPVTVELSDRYPNIEAFADVRDRSGGRLGYHTRSIDATGVPADLGGVRTMFSAFHHFPPEVATAILADAVRKRCAIAIFEGINHRAVGLLMMPLQLPVILLLTPFVRPFRWSRLLFTYALPLIPLLVLFDGTVSMLRLYSEDALRELVTGIPGHEDFAWDIGSTVIGGTPIGLTHLIGVPKR